MKFTYQARSREGIIKSGIVAASDAEKASSLLAENGLTIISLTEKREEWYRKLDFLSGRVSSKELVLFSRQLATLVSARVPIMQSLRILQTQVENKKLMIVLQEMVAAIENGESLSLALSKYPEVFSNVYVALVRSGEASGTLHKSLEYLAVQLEKEYDLRIKVRNALTYPAFVLGLLLLVGGSMFKFVLPKMLQILTEQNAELPLVTKMLIFTTDFINDYWIAIILFIVFSVAFVRYYIFTVSGRYLWDGLKIHLPLIGDIFTRLYITRFSRNLSTLIAGGIPILQSFRIISGVMNNVIYRDIVLTATQYIAQGKGMGDSLSGHKEFPEIVIQMIRVGEQTARVDDILNKLAEFYEKEVEAKISVLASLIEPIMMIILGIAVGILVAGVILPIYNLAATG